jgi:hypothetical protein
MLFRARDFENHIFYFGENRGVCSYTGRFIKFSMITNIYNKNTKGPTLMELFTVTGKLNKFFDN